MNYSLSGRIAERNEFRNSDTWKDFRQTMYLANDGKDYITSANLTDCWNLHHLNVNHLEYTNISTTANFIPLNKTTHELVHSYFDNGISAIPDTCLSAHTMNTVLARMEELNKDNIELVLFRNHIDYHFDESDKNFTCQAARDLGLATDKFGMIYWNPNTPGSDKNQPLDSVKWVLYYHKKNNWTKDDAMLGMELRHLCLWSSLKNIIRPEIKAKWSEGFWNKTVDTLKTELIKTTKFINKYSK